MRACGFHKRIVPHRPIAMSQPLRISPVAASSLGLAFASVASGILTVLSEFDFFLLGVVAFGVMAIGFGIYGIRQVCRNPSEFRGAALAAWGIGLPLALCSPQPEVSGMQRAGSVRRTICVKSRLR